MASKLIIPDLSVSPRFNLNVSPAIRFAGEFASVIRRTSFIKAIELGLQMFADAAETEEKANGKSWRDYWERSEGSPAVAWALLLADRALPFDFEQQQVRDFILAHEKFFFTREGKTLVPKRRHIEALWPHVQNGVLPAHWEKSKAVDSYATGEKMCEILKKAGPKPPAWGPGHE